MKLPRTILRALCYRRYHSAQLWEAYDTRRYPHRKQPVLVYQMGKVGSSSVHRSLSACRGVASFHVHFLTHGQVRRMADAYARFFPTRRNIPDHLRNSLFLRRQLDLGRIDHRWKVITLIRDPLARLFSGFFQTFPEIYPDFDLDARLETTEPAALAEELVPLFDAWKGSFITPEEWLDTELKAVFGVDVFASEFPKETGYRVYEEGRAPVLLIQLERLDACAREALGAFLGLDAFTLVRANESANKKYGPVYDAFRSRYGTTSDRLDAVYDTRFARHFYTEAELAAFRRRWGGQG